MAYASTSNVAALCATLLEGEADFSASTSPTSAQVESFLSSGCGLIEGILIDLGYDPPPASTTIAYSILSHLNAIYGAAMAELSLMNTSLTPEERTRAEYLESLFWREVERLKGMDLSSMGLTRASRGVLYAGGISQSDKHSYDKDTDRVEPRFRRGQFAFPETIRAWEITAS